MKILLVCLAFCATGFAQDTISKLSAADLARGKKLFEAQCSLCHGQTGLGGKGPNLAQPVLKHAPDNDRLAEVIKSGIRGTEMPGAWQMTDREVWQVAGYVRSLGRIEAVKLPGDAERGRVLYDKSGCAGCHIVQGAGGSLGPELSDIGARRSAAFLKESLVDPAASVAEADLVVSVTTADGKIVRGIRVNEDSFSIQVRDASNRFHSFRKRDTTVKKEFKASLMPAYGKLSAAELDDVIAYLASLRGKS